MMVIGWMLLSASIDWTEGLYNEQLVQCGGPERHQCEMNFNLCREEAAKRNRLATHNKIYFCVAVYGTEGDME